MDDLYTQIKRFFEPESVAMIGVSTRTGPGSFNIMEAVLQRGFKGRIYGVNPKGGEILGGGLPNPGAGSALAGLTLPLPSRNKVRGS